MTVLIDSSSDLAIPPREETHAGQGCIAPTGVLPASVDRPPGGLSVRHWPLRESRFAASIPTHCPNFLIIANPGLDSAWGSMGRIRVARVASRQGLSGEVIHLSDHADFRGHF